MTKNGIALALAVALVAGCGPDVVENGPTGPQVYRFAVLATPAVKAPAMPMPGKPGPRHGDRRADTQARADKPPDVSEAVSAMATEGKLDFVVYLGGILGAETPEEAKDALTEFHALTDMIPAPAYVVLGEPDAKGPLARADLLRELADHLPGGSAYWMASPRAGLHVVALDTSGGPAPKEQLDWLEAAIRKVPQEERVVVFSYRSLDPSWDPGAHQLLARYPNVKLYVYADPAMPDGGLRIGNGAVGTPAFVTAPALASGRYLVATVESEIARVESRPIREEPGAARKEPTLVPLPKAPAP